MKVSISEMGAMTDGGTTMLLYPCTSIGEIMGPKLHRIIGSGLLVIAAHGYWLRLSLGHQF
jgi:hypothetical protein